jgi:hypothetical protein
MEGVRFRGTVIGAVMGAVVLAGCSSGGGSRPAAQKSPDPITTTPLATTPSPTAAQEAALHAYSVFWSRLVPASRAKSPTAQLALLVPVTTDPELSQLIAGFARLHNQGRALYGRNLPRPSSVTVSNGRAVIRDCQDSHAAGVERVATGQRITVGVLRHPITATLLLRGSEWKVSRVDYAPAGTSC